MEKLRLALGLDREYIDALPTNDSLVGRILNSVHSLRSRNPYSPWQHPSPFIWPNNIDDLAIPRDEIGLWSIDFQELLSQDLLVSPYLPLTYARNHYDIAEYSSLREYFILTPPRIACSHSHLTAIHKIANSISVTPGTALILEDDVDVEVDILSQVSALWPNPSRRLRYRFLAAYRFHTRIHMLIHIQAIHCWSDESLGRPLTSGEGTFSASRLFYPTKPKCTHAYALSRMGAR